MDCAACHNKSCLTCLKVNNILNKGKPYNSNSPYDTHHCEEHCDIDPEDLDLIPEVHLIDERWKKR